MKRIASENDTEEIEKLVQLVLGCVVQCENNQEYIQRITSLSESSQSELMVRIQKVCCQIEEIKIKPKKNQKKKKKIMKEATTIEENKAIISMEIPNV